MSYVDGFVFVVAKNKINEYKKMASVGKKIWMKHGALDYKECMADDLSEQMPGAGESKFIKMTKLNKSKETVWFSFITYKSKAHRNAVNAKVMNDPAMNPEKWKDKAMPFDMKRMAYGGFETIIE